jgi:sulfide:quinone oxidoreductase
MKHLIILGAGTAGTLMAHKLRRALSPTEWAMTLIDRDDQHLYQPGLLFVPFGDMPVERIARRRRDTLPEGVTLNLSGVEALAPAAREVTLGDGTRHVWDILIVATGARLAPEDTPGLTGPGWYGHTDTATPVMFDFYTPAGALALRSALERLESGRLVVNFVDVPIKCPVAPLEFAFLADAWLEKRGRRKDVEIVYATPLDGAFTKPRASALLGNLMADRHIRVEPNFALAEADGQARVLRAYDGRELDFSLFVTVPLHAGAPFIRASGLGNAQGFVPTHKHTLQSSDFPHVFAIGDATDLPTSKAGSVAHFQGDVLAPNILRHIRGEPLLPDFDGHANCFIETGHDKALLIDFNYDTEPLPGRFPLPGLGPFTLLEESRMNHIGKLGFEWVYWNMLVQGRDLPIEHRMTMAGKWA